MTASTPMTGLVFEENTLSVRTDLDCPTPKAGEALIKIRQGGICNTDLELVKGYMGFQGILGHEFVGDVVEASGAEQWVGKRVCADINAACEQANTMNHCDTCGHPHHCPNRTVIGIDRHHGAFTDYLVAPIRNLYEVPDGVSDDAAVFCEPLAAAFEIPEQVTIERNQEIIVLGDGKLGLLIAMALRQVCEHVTLAGRHPDKLALVDSLDIETVLSAQLDRPLSADVVVEATGTAGGLQQAMELAKPRGTIVLKSTVADGTALNLAPIVINELTLLGSRCGPFDKALAALEQAKLPVEALIQGRYSLSQGLEAMEHAQKKGTLKILLTP